MIPSIKSKDRSHISTSTRLSLGSKKSSSFGSTYPIQSEYSGKQQYLRTWEEPTFESILYSSSPSALPTFFSPNKYQKRAYSKTNTCLCRTFFTSHKAISDCILLFASVFPCAVLSTLQVYEQSSFHPSFSNSLLSLANQYKQSFLSLVLPSPFLLSFLHHSFVSNKHTHIAYPL